MQSVTQTQYNRARLVNNSFPFDISNYEEVNCTDSSDAATKLKTLYREDAQVITWFDNRDSESNVVTIDGVRYTIFTIRESQLVRNLHLHAESASKAFVVLDGNVIFTSTMEPMAHDEEKGRLFRVITTPFPLFLTKTRSLQVWVVTPTISFPLQLRYQGGCIPSLKLNSFSRATTTPAPTRNPFLLGLNLAEPQTVRVPTPSSPIALFQGALQLFMSYFLSSESPKASIRGCNDNNCPFTTGPPSPVYSVSPYLCLIDTRTGDNLATENVSEFLYPEEPSQTNLSQFELTTTTSTAIQGPEEKFYRSTFTILPLRGNELSGLGLTNANDVGRVTLKINGMKIWSGFNTNKSFNFGIGYSNPLPLTPYTHYTVEVDLEGREPNLVYNTSTGDLNSCLTPFFVENYNLKVENDCVTVAC